MLSFHETGKPCWRELGDLACDSSKSEVKHDDCYPEIHSRYSVGRSFVAWALGDQSSVGREGLVRYLNGIARSQLDRRARAMAQVRTRADAERRKAMVREKILRLIGGIFENQGPVSVKQFGELAG